MPGENTIEAVHATIANRAKTRPHYTKTRSNESAPHETGPIYLEVGSSSRSSGCVGHSDADLAERLVMLVECVSKIVKQKRKGTKENMTVLLFCEDGYVRRHDPDLTSHRIELNLPIRRPRRASLPWPIPCLLGTSD